MNKYFFCKIDNRHYSSTVTTTILTLSPSFKTLHIKTFQVLKRFIFFQDVRDAFPDVQVFSVSIEHNDGRFKASARLLLENPEVLDEWPESRQNAFVKNKEVRMASALHFFYWIIRLSCPGSFFIKKPL